MAARAYDWHGHFAKTSRVPHGDVNPQPSYAGEGGEVKPLAFGTSTVTAKPETSDNTKKPAWYDVREWTVGKTLLVTLIGAGLTAAIFQKEAPVIGSFYSRRGRRFF